MNGSIIILILLAGIVFLLLLKKKEGYGSKDYEFGDHKQMSQLPWCTPPTGIGAIGRAQCSALQQIYPGQRFFTSEIPQVKPYGCSSRRDATIFETGNSANPNTTNSWGILTQYDIDY